MAVPVNAESIPTYMVYRDVSDPAAPFDPTAPLLFFPPKGSDELFDALRVAFPHVKSHSERMRDAIIQFLLEERQQEDQLVSPAVSMDPLSAVFTSMSSSSDSTWSSPELLNFPTPAGSFANSPVPAPRLAHHQASSQASPATQSLDQMTGVFSLTPASQPKQRVRRKMTDAEKAEYRKRRIVKACDKCAKRKRKCPHNQSEMANVPNKASTRSAKAPSTKSLTPTNTAQAQQFAPEVSMSLDELANTFDPSEFITFDDFDMFDDSYETFDISNVSNWSQTELPTPEVSPIQRDWSFGPQVEDHTLLDPRVSTHMPALSMSSLAWETYGDTILDHNEEWEQTPHGLLDNCPDRFGDIHALAKAGGLDRQGGRQTSHLLLGSHEAQAGGTGMIWEHVRTGQGELRSEKPVPTHTAHLHNAEIAGERGVDNSITRPQVPSPQPSLPQTVLRLTATARALKLALRSRGSSQAVTLDMVVNALRDRDLHDHGQLLQQGAGNMPAHLQRSLFEASPLAVIEARASSYSGDETCPSRATPSAMRRQGERFLLEVSSSPPLSSSLLAGESGETGERLTLGQAIQQPLPSAAAHSTKPSQHSSITTPGRRPQPSLGEGISSEADSASELYVAKHRIAPRLHRYVSQSGQTPPGRTRTNVPLDRTVFVEQSNSASSSSLLRYRDNSPLFGNGTHANDGASAGPVHTRPRKPTTSGSGSGDVQAVHQERLSDHVRYRDHHGRAGSVVESAGWLALLGAFFILLAVSGLPGLPLLAFFTVESEKDNPVYKTFVRCSKKNSSWLSTYVSMQLSTWRTSSRGRGSEKEFEVDAGRLGMQVGRVL